MFRLIGGEFELSYDNNPPKPFRPTESISGSWTVSGRAALYAILKNLKQKGVKKIIIPSYLCESILQPIKTTRLEYEYYPVDENLAALPQPQKGTALLLIHYFGWLNPSTKLLRQEAKDSFFLIEDMSHAVFSSWNLNNYHHPHIFFSLRKFGPVPLGGWFNKNLALPPSVHFIECLYWKSISARLLKHNYLTTVDERKDSIERTYLDWFNSVEKALNKTCVAYGLNKESKQLIEMIDWEKAMVKRQDNWRNLHTLLGLKIHSFHTNLENDVIPLGYVIRSSDRDKLRKRLMDVGVFCPIHWKLPKEIDEKRFPISNNLSKSILTIPIDQRYGQQDMEFINQVIKGF